MSEEATKTEPTTESATTQVEVAEPTEPADDQAAATPDADAPAEESAGEPAETEDVETGEDGEDGGSGGENPLDVEGEIAADYLEELLDIADLDGDIDTYIESNRPHVSVLTEGDVLVGEHGEVLEALQELSRLAVMTETGNRSRLMLDVSGYRDKRRQELVALATDAVQEVQDSGESVRLQPMNPFERKIVHDAVAAAGLVSESEGEEPRRRVIVQPGA